MNTTKCNCTSGKEIALGSIIYVKPILSLNDVLTNISIRLGIVRDKRQIKIGLYAVGIPGPNSPLLVSSNYELSFNKLRSSLKKINAWILVIDTKGVNVWCAAGKGTFGTKEIIKRIKEYKIENLITHKTVILPQLGASNTCAHAIEKETGLKVVFGPVRATDIPEFIKMGNTKTKSMRTITFNFFERIVLIPVELAYSIKYLFLLILVLFFITIFNFKTLGLHSDINRFTTLLYGLLLAYASGVIITQSVLTIIPFRSFILKGFFTGLTLQILFLFFYSHHMSLLMTISTLLLFPALSAFLAFNFTGCSTYTSPTGVKKEIKLFIKPLIFITATGLFLLIISILGDL